MRSQVWDQIGPFGIWPHQCSVEVDGRAVRNTFIQRISLASLKNQQAEELEALRSEFARGSREGDADTDVVWGRCVPSDCRWHATHDWRPVASAPCSCGCMCDVAAACVLPGGARTVQGNAACNQDGCIWDALQFRQRVAHLQGLGSA